MTQLTELRVHKLFNRWASEESNIAVEKRKTKETLPKGQQMSPSIFIAFVLLGSGASALRRGGQNDLITPRPYNNQHSDATAARDERSLMLLR